MVTDYCVNRISFKVVFLFQVIKKRQKIMSTNFLIKWLKKIKIKSIIHVIFYFILKEFITMSLNYDLISSRE